MFEKRVKSLNDKFITQDVQGVKTILYVMSRDQRVRDNYALLYAQSLGKVVVMFNLYPLVAHRIYQQYEFMVEGLKEVQAELEELNIPFIVTVGKAGENLDLIEQSLSPAAFVFDFSPLCGPRKLHNDFAKRTKVPAYEVDAHNVIPAWVASDKEEYGAYTLRPKIYKQIKPWVIEPDYPSKQKELVDLSALNSVNASKNPIKKTSIVKKSDTNIANPGAQNNKVFINLDSSSWEDIAQSIKAENIAGYNPEFKSGSNSGMSILRDFLEHKIEFYAEKRNNPTLDFQSNLSPYLHFGQVSSLRIILEVQKFAKDKFGKDFELDFSKILNKNKAGKSHTASLEDSIYAFIEEIVVRKELADNYCYYNPNYNKVEGAKDWALKSHTKHSKDRREFLYSFDQLEFAQTNDPAWNAAQKQLTTKGKIHGYMRMYWAKKFLEWTQSPRQALEWCIKLNDKYSLDGYDPNGYAGIQWSINGVHDRPWFERPIYGQIRYMSYEGLKKKFDVELYINSSPI